MPDLRFKDRVAVVTGSAVGLGRAYAAALAGEGAAVVVADIDGDGADAVAAELRDEGSVADAVRVDVADEESVARMVSHTVDTFGGLDILVNNAAVMFRFLDDPRKPFWEYTIAEWELIQAVNVKGPWLCARAVLPVMKRAGRGKIVNISSNMAHGTDLPFPSGMAAYTTSKAAVIGLTRAIAGEVGVMGVNVNAVAPGVTATETVAEHIAGERLAQMAEVQAIKRVAEPRDIVGTVLFLCSDAADFVTGQTVIVDGGFMTA